MKRYGLLWMSREDVVRVRNELIGLYLKPDEPLTVPIPRVPASFTPIVTTVTPDCSTIRIFTGTYPRFVWYYQTYWLKCPKAGDPYWDYRGTNRETGAVIRIPFKDRQARIPATLVKEFARYFPFLPTDNYLTHPKDKFYA